MEVKLEEFPPTCMALGDDGWIAIGSVDGSLRLQKIDLGNKKMLVSFPPFVLCASFRTDKS